MSLKKVSFAAVACLFALASIASAELITDSSLVMHLRADSGVTTSGGVVTQWNDMSGHNNNATVPSWGGSGTTVSPTGFGPNDYAYLQMGANQSLVTPVHLAGASARTIFAILQLDATQTAAGINVVGVPYQSGTTGSGFVLQERGAVPVGYPYVAGWAADLNSGVTTKPSAITAIAATYDGTTESLYWQVSDGTAGSVSAARTLNTMNWPVYIGSFTGTATNGNGITGKIAEIAVYNRALSSAELAQNQAYYVDRYITTVPEPGALALSATGLIGLLCYAWRKQK